MACLNGAEVPERYREAHAQHEADVRAAQQDEQEWREHITREQVNAAMDHAFGITTPATPGEGAAVVTAAATATSADTSADETAAATTTAPAAAAEGEAAAMDTATTEEATPAAGEPEASTAPAETSVAAATVTPAGDGDDPATEVAPEQPAADASASPGGSGNVTPDKIAQLKSMGFNVVPIIEQALEAAGGDVGTAAMFLMSMQ
jgi:hypothetical protein